MKIKFLRTGTARYKRLGKGIKKKQRWRRARGRHNKIREGKKSTRRKVEIGFKGGGKSKENKKIILVRNLKEAGKVKKGELIIIGKVGRKKREQIEKKILEMGGGVLNKLRERK